MLPVQASPAPTLPAASDVSHFIVNSGAAKLANVALSVLPYVITALVLFWAIRFSLRKLGLTESAIVGEDD